MGEYIKKDKLIKAFYDEMQSMKNTNRSEAADNVFGILMRYVNSFEAADVQPVKHGRWIEHHDLIECNVCGFEVKDTYCEKRDITSSETSYDYCPKCGARMDGEQQ